MVVRACPAGRRRPWSRVLLRAAAPDRPAPGGQGLVDERLRLRQALDRLPEPQRILWTDGRPTLLPADFRTVAVNASGLVVGEHGRLEDRRAAVTDGAVADLPMPGRRDAHRRHRGQCPRRGRRRRVPGRVGRGWWVRRWPGRRRCGRRGCRAGRRVAGRRRPAPAVAGRRQGNRPGRPGRPGRPARPWPVARRHRHHPADAARRRPGRGQDPPSATATPSSARPPATAAPSRWSGRAAPDRGDTGRAVEGEAGREQADRDVHPQQGGRSGGARRAGVDDRRRASGEPGPSPPRSTSSCSATAPWRPAACSTPAW